MSKTKYSYLYNGKVVRNSNRLYKYGLVNHCNAVISCSNTEKGALKDKIWLLNLHKRNLAYYIKHNDKEFIEETKQDIANVEKWHIVELGVRVN